MELKEEVQDGIRNSKYISSDIRKKYLRGRKNKVVKMYFYIKKGLDVVNDFKYIIAGILGLYYTLQLDDPKLLIILLLASIPILLILGYIWVHHAGKTMEWINVEYASYWTRYNYSLQEKQLELFENLSKEINRLNESLNQSQKK